jgi:hypothetical protein
MKNYNRLRVGVVVFVSTCSILVNSCHVDEYRFPLIPIVITSAPTNITNRSVTCGGDVTTGFGYKILFRGICRSTNHTPTITDSLSLYSVLNDNGLGKYSTEVSGLVHNTTYYVRAYAINSNGIGYGSTISFTTED